MLKNPSLQVIRIPDIQSFIRTFYDIDIMHGNFHFVLLISAILAFSYKNDKAHGDWHLIVPIPMGYGSMVLRLQGDYVAERQPREPLRPSSQTRIGPLRMRIRQLDQSRRPQLGWLDRKSVV